MSKSEKDPVTALAEEIRAAIADTAPSSEAGAASIDELPETSEETEALRAVLSRAEARVTPTIPGGARFAGMKGLALRLLRFLWRDQASFNALSLEAQLALVQALEQNRREVKRAVRRLERSLAERDASWGRRAAIQDGRLSALEAHSPPAEASAKAKSAAGAAPSPPAAPAFAEIPPGVYSLFEERFRGEPASVAEKQRSYLPFLKDVPGPVLDVGCGRGEFLAALREANVPASGVDTNPLSVALGREAGFEIEEGDGIEALTRRPPRSLGGVVAFQVVEHWTAEATWAFLRAARRALAPGGVLIAETINTDSLSALKAFFLDPTHVRPVPADALKFLAEAAGFADVSIEYRAPLRPEERLVEASPNDARLNRLLFGPQDYALVARVPREIG